MSKLVEINHNGQRVLTTAQLAEAFGAENKIVTNNFSRNKERYTAGKHYFELRGQELEVFKGSHQFDANLKFAPVIYLWTEKGAWMHAKSLNTDEAWEAYELLIDDYYHVKSNGSEPRPLSEKEQLKASMKLSLITSEEIEGLKVEVTEVREKVDLLVNSMRIDGTQEFELRDSGQKKVLEVLGGIKSPAYEEVGRKAFAELWRSFKQHFTLPRYSELPRSQFDEGMYFISKWRPSTSLEIEIERCNRQVQLKLVKA